jgi:N-acetylglucosaminyl-diphospho-decaprenol L-rhamnosyltransferase
MSYKHVKPQSIEITVSISVISHGQGDLVEDMLASLAQHKPPFPIEVLLTENIPEQSGIELVTLPFPVRITRNQSPRGFAANHNHAFRIAKGEYFCLLNPDVVFIENIFPRLIASLKDNLGNIIAPLILNSNGEIQDSFRELPKPQDIVRRRLRPWNPPTPLGELDYIYPDWIAAICLMMKRETYEILEGLDEKFYLYYEDVDFGCRARLAGRKLIVDPRCRIIHDARRRSHRSFRYLFHHLNAARRFYTSDVYHKAKTLPSK